MASRLTLIDAVSSVMLRYFQEPGHLLPSHGADSRAPTMYDPEPAPAPHPYPRVWCLWSHLGSWCCAFFASSHPPWVGCLVLVWCKHVQTVCVIFSTRTMTICRLRLSGRPQWPCLTCEGAMLVENLRNHINMSNHSDCWHL